MKNVLLILDEKMIAVNVVETAIKISKTNRSAIQVLFTHSQSRSASDDSSTKNKNLVTGMCSDAGIEVVILNENDIPLNLVLQQDPSINLVIAESPKAANAPTITTHLANAKCPVYLISADSNKIGNIIFSYDGSFSSINAIKEYTQRFPETLKLPTHFVQLSSDDNDEFLRQKNIESWLPQSYSNAQYSIFNGDTRTEFFNFIASIPDCLAVIGSHWNKRGNHLVY
ncbi:MAG: hypothetical protein QM737_22120 [Ferruginibacter sp.]